MQFHRLRDMPIRASDSIYRASKTGPIIALVILSVMIAVVHWFPEFQMPFHFGQNWITREWRLEAYLILGVCVLGFSYGTVVVHGSQNWLVRHGDAGLAINLRSYNARHSSDDLVIVQFDRDEVESVRAVRVRMPWKRRTGEIPEDRSYIDLTLKKAANTAPLAAVLRADRDRRLGRSRKGARADDLFPPLDTKLKNSGEEKFCLPDAVRLIGDSVIRIDWRGPVTPIVEISAERISRWLRVPIGPPLAIDFRSKPQTGEDREQLIGQMLTLGEYSRAKSLARRLEKI